MATMTTFEAVSEAFERVYEQLREDNGENAPNSNTWFARTAGELAEQVNSDGSDSDNIASEEPDATVGPEDGATIAWVYECNGQNLYRITDGASENELVTLFGRCMGYDL